MPLKTYRTISDTPAEILAKIPDVHVGTPETWAQERGIEPTSITTHTNARDYEQVRYSAHLPWLSVSYVAWKSQQGECKLAIRHTT